MLTDILSEELYRPILKGVSISDIYEIRMRKDKNVVISIKGNYTDTGVLCRQEWIAETVLRASRFSIYAVNEQIKNGFIGVKGGIRIGLCGETVYDNQKIKTIKNISSLNIRLPHEIKGCSDEVIKRCFKKALLSTLIISKPGAGKTTMIRDICRNLSLLYKNINILILDERGEISGEAEGSFQFDIGLSDCLINCKKEYGFSAGIRSMRPDVIVCDELKGLQDIDSVYEALSCGVCIIATVHSDGIEETVKKEGLNRIIHEKIFGRYVVLTDKPCVGTVKNIYDENLEVLV